LASVGHGAAPSISISQSNASLVANLRYGLIFASRNERSIPLRRSDGDRPHLSCIVVVGLGVVEESTNGGSDDVVDDGDGLGVMMMMGKLGRASRIARPCRHHSHSSECFSNRRCYCQLMTMMLLLQCDDDDDED